MSTLCFHLICCWKLGTFCRYFRANACKKWKCVCAVCHGGATVTLDPRSSGREHVAELALAKSKAGCNAEPADAPPIAVGREKRALAPLSSPLVAVGLFSFVLTTNQERHKTEKLFHSSHGENPLLVPFPQPATFNNTMKNKVWKKRRGGKWIFWAGVENSWACHQQIQPPWTSGNFHNGGWQLGTGPFSISKPSWKNRPNLALLFSPRCQMSSSELAFLRLQKPWRHYNNSAILTITWQIREFEVNRKSYEKLWQISNWLFNS